MNYFLILNTNLCNFNYFQTFLGDIHLTAPGFSISAQSLREVTLGDWHLANPVIILQL